MQCILVRFCVAYQVICKIRVVNSSYWHQAQLLPIHISNNLDPLTPPEIWLQRATGQRALHALDSFPKSTSQDPISIFLLSRWVNLVPGKTKQIIGCK